jgi:hypothetical protein
MFISLCSLHYVLVVLTLFPRAVYKASFFPASSPTFVGGVFDDSYLNGSELES